MKKYIIGLGTGRCGSMSVAHFLKDNECNIEHERFRKKSCGILSWDFNQTQADWILDRLKSLDGDMVGDVAFYYINYIDFLKENLQDLKIVATYRNKEKVVESYNRKTLNRNHWIDNPREHGFEEYTLWDSAYPHFSSSLTKKEAIAKYYDEYNKKLFELKNKYPDDVIIFDIEELNDKDNQNKLLDFCSIEHKKINFGKKNALLDLSKEVTAFVISIEQGKNYEECLKALDNQTVQYKIDQIPNISPKNIAFNQMIERVETPYFIQVDEDMILTNDAVETMYKKITKTSDNVPAVTFKLHDVHLNETIGSCCIYKTDIIKKYPFSSAFCCELSQRDKMHADGYHILPTPEIVGEHSPHWNNKTIFQHYYNIGKRQNQKNIHSDYPKKLLKIYNKKPSNLNLFALLGCVSGILSKEEDTVERDFSKYAEGEYNIISDVFKNSNIQEQEFITQGTNHSYLKVLGNHINVEYQNNYDKIKNSDKSLIIWNPYSYVKSKKYLLYNYFKESNKTVYAYERGALPGTIFLDKNGLLCDSSSYDKKYWNKPLTLEQNKKIEGYIKEFKYNENSLEKQNNFKVRVNKTCFNAELNIANFKKKIFIPLQVHNDTVMILWSDWVIDLPRFQSTIKKLAKENPDICFLVKNHPVQLSSNKFIFNNETDNIKVVDGYHYKDCIEHSDMVITVNSGIGLQAMMWKKPVIICGKAFYQIDDINLKINSYKELQKVINHEFDINFEKAKRFLYYLKYEFYSDCNMQKISGNVSKLLNISRLVYRNNKDKLKIIESFDEKNTSIIQQVFNVFKIYNKKPCLLKKACLYALKYNDISRLKIIHLDVELTEETKIELLNKGFNIQKNVISKKDIKFIIEQNPKQRTKQWSCSGFEVTVPLPVVPYMKNLYGRDWKKNE